MGAGCYHLNYKKNKAAWIDFEISEVFDSNYIIEDIGNIIKSIGYYQNDDLEFSNSLFKLKFEYTCYGDGLIIQLVPRYSELDYWTGNKNPLYCLAMANYDKAELKIWKALQKAGYKLNIATSGYTSMELGKL